MQFSVGDRVIHPTYGAGQITDTEDLELIEGFEHYYVIDILAQNVIVRVPMRKMQDLGVRPIMTEAKMAHMLETLRATPSQLSTDFKERRTRIQEKLNTGRPLKIAEVVRDLTWHKRETHLTKADSDLLAHGQTLLATEVALVTDTEVAQARETIDSALAVSTP